MSEIYVGRQPVLDNDMKVFAYEIEFKQKIKVNADTVADTSQLIEKIEEDVGFQAVVGEQNAILNFPIELTHPDHFPSFIHSNVIVQIPNNVIKNLEVLRNLREAKSQGMGIVLDNYIGDESSQKLANICDYVKVNVAEHSEVKLKEIVQDLHAMDLYVIANQVETEEMFHYLVKLGFDYFQGYFFTNPLMINGTKLSGNKLTLLHLIAKVNSPDTKFAELSEIISQDVALSHKLLVAINNPASLLPTRVDSIAEALKYMGLKRLKFWVNMLLLSGMDNAPQELIITSLMRAKFCEMIADSSGRNAQRDTYFLIGLFSNLGAFFRVPIEEVVAEMPLTQEVEQALIYRVGELGKTLRLLEYLEQASDMLMSLEIDNVGVDEVSHHFMAASAWAQTVVKD